MFLKKKCETEFTSLKIHFLFFLSLGGWNVTDLVYFPNEDNISMHFPD